MAGNNSSALSTLQKTILLSGIVAIINFFLSACSIKPISPYSEASQPLVLVPVSHAAVQDKRGRFREIFCAVLEERRETLPDYRSCDNALTRVGNEPEGSGQPVHLGSSERALVAVIVPGVGWNCFAKWLDTPHTAGDHVREFGFDKQGLKIDDWSSTAGNAQLIRDQIINLWPETTQPNLVLIGYSKGAPDILNAVVYYTEIRNRIAAIISVAGAIGGSPLANDATPSQLELMSHWPGAECSLGDGGAIESLRPATRMNWLAENPLPHDFPYYSLVAYPNPERISSILKFSYNKLSKVDARNDGQLLFYDQVIPGSGLVGFVNADHWALVVPIARTHPIIGSMFVDQNHYPREALLEALLRFVEEDISIPIQ